MNTISRIFMFIYSLILSLVSMVLLYAIIDDGIFADLLSPLSTIVTHPVGKIIYACVLILILVSSITTITIAITSGRMSKTRIRNNEMGAVDIGADAIESIALNSAKSAQVGIKSSKVRVTPGKNDSIKVYLTATLYSNVEIPASMVKVQEKIKKDIERYTGIAVDSVTIKVSRVEPIVARVDK